MLIAIFSYFFLSNFNEENFIQLTRDYAQSQNIERQQILNKDAENMETHLQAYAYMSNEAVEVIQNTQLTREETKSLLVRYNDKREARLQSVMDTRYKIKNELSREEWKEAFQ